MDTGQFTQNVNVASYKASKSTQKSKILDRDASNADFWCCHSPAISTIPATHSQNKPHTHRGRVVLECEASSPAPKVTSPHSYPAPHFFRQSFQASFLAASQGDGEHLESPEAEPGPQVTTMRKGWTPD